LLRTFKKARLLKGGLWRGGLFLFGKFLQSVRFKYDTLLSDLK
jgi:hypothetical protein